MPPGGFNKYFNRCFIIPPFTQTIGRSDTERVIAWAKIGIGYTTVIICDTYYWKVRLSGDEFTAELVYKNIYNYLMRNN